MTDLLLLIQLILGLVQFLVGIVANGIIVLVSGFESIKKKRMSTYDLLLTCLGIFRIFLQVLLIVGNLVFFFTLELYVSHETFLFFLFISEVNLWLATYLCVFYCVKIANIIHPFFLWLKLRISRLVPWLILGSVLFSSAISICHGILYWPGAKPELRRFLAGNITSHVLLSYLFPTPILVIGLVMPLCMFIVSSFLLIYSLRKHIKHMRSMATGFRDPSTEAHIRAMKSVFSFLVLCGSYYFAVVMLFSKMSGDKGIFLFFSFSVTALYPSGHSIILILGNSKLKHYTRKLLFSAMCCLGGGSA